MHQIGLAPSFHGGEHELGHRNSLTIGGGAHRASQRNDHRQLRLIERPGNDMLSIDVDEDGFRTEERQGIGRIDDDVFPHRHTEIEQQRLQAGSDETTIGRQRRVDQYQ